MNRVEKAVAAAKVLHVPREVAEQALALSQRLIIRGECKSVAMARMRAAQIVAGEHKTMPGPVLLAMGLLAAERAGPPGPRAVDPRPGQGDPDCGGPTGPAADLEWHDKFDD
jgi:hypothetical protein